MKDFLVNKVPELLKNLKSDTKADFGLMTPQHMVEHLTWITKVTTTRKGVPEDGPIENKMQKFFDAGCIFKHRPKEGETAADLPALKYGSLEEAIEQVPIAIKRFYDHYEADPDFKCYNPFMGEVGFTDIQKFHFQHYSYHFWQFGLLPSYYEVAA